MSDTKLYRRATAEDSWDWLQIRNDPEALFWSGNTRAITVAEHTAWFTNRSQHPGHVLLVHEDDTLQSLGLVGTNALGRLQQSVQAEVSLGVSPASRGHGVGAGMLRALEQEAVERRVHRLVAYIHPANIPSMRAFMRQGYVLGGNPGFVRVEKPL